ncbi:GntR family transcriptional regulator [Hydrogenispora ethanolica]|uniref:GntR family transcriptional regulator n=1 Tax=Hydrogenispora ethanolica TaxID=1082276 RepID=A0A4R1R819_HYDET|nr:FadR/GntR family transcriptional regulator [Hydrogenispora ethanolica]TCL61783.1 GntR family transcriptional regulator [Hydrogenispora ethanolica]
MDIIKSIARKKVWEEVSDRIKSMIIKGYWKPGDKLPAEVELAHQFGISRPTLREAIRHLSLMGLIDVRHGEGNFVSLPQAESFMRPLLPMLLQDRENILAVMEARRMIEVQNAACAALRLGEGQLQILESSLQEMAEVSDEEQFAKIDHLFHKTIAISTKNPIIFKMYEAVEDLLLGLQLRTIVFPGAMPDGFSEHQEIVKAIARRDSKLAGEAMNHHMEKTLKRILENITN